MKLKMVFVAFSSFFLGLAFAFFLMQIEHNNAIQQSAIDEAMAAGALANNDYKTAMEHSFSSIIRNPNGFGGYDIINSILVRNGDCARIYILSMAKDRITNSDSISAEIKKKGSQQHQFEISQLYAKCQNIMQVVVRI